MQDFQIPARPWTEADVAFLTHNADYLPEDIRGELGLTPAIPDNNFQADFDAAREIETPVVETAEVAPVVADQATAPVVEEVTTEGELPTEPEAAVVDNTATDNA